MSIALITQPAILRRYFAYTRQGLLGQWPQKTSQVQPGVPQPVIETVSHPVSPSQESIQRPTQEIELPEAFELSPVTKEEKFPELSPVPEQWVVDTQSVETRPAAVQSQVPSFSTTPEYSQSSNYQTTPTSPTSAIYPITWWKPITRFILSIVILASVVVAGVIIVPELYATVFPKEGSVAQVASVAKSTEVAPHQGVEQQPYLPPQNPDLPEGSWISIPSIGVYSELLPTSNPDEALDKGVWMVPDFGRPGDYSQPTIVAAHRYGWDWWWQTDYWKYNSFYLLTETKPGDTVEIIYDKRKWVYQIYAAEEGELITDYSADLILYTCKYLNSPIRHFRYAKVVVPDQAAEGASTPVR